MLRVSLQLPFNENPGSPTQEDGNSFCLIRFWNGFYFILIALLKNQYFLGLVAASKDSLNWILGSPGKGRAAILVVGGAAEALYNEPGVYKIVLKHRKGFCRVALHNG